MRFICFKIDQTIKPIMAGHVIWKDAYSTSKKVTTDVMIMLGYKGCIRVTFEDHENLIERGTFQILFPGAVHSVSVDDNTSENSYFSCFFVSPENYFIVEADSINDVEREDLCVLPEFSKINDCEKHFVLFSQLIDEYDNPLLNEPFKTSICDSYTKILLSSLADAALRYNGEDKRRTSIEKILHWLRLNAKRGITAKDAAKALNYNADYLNQIIKTETGMTLAKYLNALRIDMAKTLLLNSDMLISQIALEVGFSDEKYFMKVFKARENITPTQYRNAYLHEVY